MKNWEGREDIKEIYYWRQLRGIGGMSSIQNISKEEYFRPVPEYFIVIPKIMSFSQESMVVISETVHKRLVFRLKDRLETGIIYDFVGYDD